MRVASDIGGTFTDLIYLDETTGEIGMTKASTTPHNFAIGVEDTLNKSAINVADTTFFVHGSTIIINAPSRFTLAMALRSMQGQFATSWSQFAAMSILMSIPIVILFFALQRYIVSGLTLGGVKG